MDTQDNSDNPLLKLVVDTNELDKKKLTELLEGYCGISKEGQIRPMPNFSRLNTTSKILAVLLAKKASQVLNYTDTNELSPKAIESITGIPGGTVRFKLMELRQKRLIDGEKGSYSIPNHAVLKINLETEQRPAKSTKSSKARVHSTKTDQISSEELTKLFNIDQTLIGEKKLDLLLSPGRYLERSLAVLSIAREIGVEALTPNEIARFLKEKIRTSVRSENISLALGRGTRFVDRFPDHQTGGYRYRIMAAGDRLLEDAIKQSGAKIQEGQNG